MMWQSAKVDVTPGTPMQKVIPASLVEPYLTSQRSVLTGFVHRARDGVPPGRASAGSELWVLRWRALALQTYTDARPYRRGRAGARAAELFLVPAPVPVGTEMYRITPDGEEFIARYDGQAWLAPPLEEAYAQHGFTLAHAISESPWKTYLFQRS